MVGEKAQGGFEWKPEYEALLDEVATTDNVDVSKWTLLRSIIRYKIEQNISMFLSGEVKKEYSRSTVAAPPGPGGLKLPPFPARERDESNPNEAPQVVLNEKEANDFKQAIYSQLDEFENPPFTIQRVCELCLRPTEHYKQLGKYLRAIEKSLLVTSTWDTFPLAPEGTSDRHAISHFPISTGTLSAPTTPIFSPIPFLHEDARRSSSRSPPPSPLVLPPMQAGGPAMPHAGAEGVEQKALGLVDEMDDPSPGHLSDHPQALSATTTTTPTAATTKPLHGSLQERFVRAKTDHQGAGQGVTESSSSSVAGEEEKKV